MTPGVAAVTPGSALENRFLADGDGLAPPPLVTRHGDVLARHAGRRALAVTRREEEVVARREVRGVLPPRLPFLARRTAREQEQRAQPQQNPHMSRAHC